MAHDEITEEIREIRRKLSEKFNYDLHLIAEDLRRREKESGRTYVRYASPPRESVEAAANKSPHTQPNSQ